MKIYKKTDEIDADLIDFLATKTQRHEKSSHRGKILNPAKAPRRKEKMEENETGETSAVGIVVN